MTEHKCFHCTNVLTHCGLATFGNKRFIRYWCASCKIDWMIEKKDASLVLTDAQREEIDNTADVKPIVAIHLTTPAQCRQVADLVRQAGAHALERTFTFKPAPKSEDFAENIVLSMHNVFRAQAVVIGNDYPDADILRRFARGLGKEVFGHFDVGMPGKLANFIRELPPPGVNLWHEQMLVDLAGMPAT